MNGGELGGGEPSTTFLSYSVKVCSSISAKLTILVHSLPAVTGRWFYSGRNIRSSLLCMGSHIGNEKHNDCIVLMIKFYYDLRSEMPIIILFLVQVICWQNTSACKGRYHMTNYLEAIPTNYSTVVGVDLLIFSKQFHNPVSIL